MSSDLLLLFCLRSGRLSVQGLVFLRCQWLCNMSELLLNLTGQLGISRRQAGGSGWGRVNEDKR